MTSGLRILHDQTDATNSFTEIAHAAHSVWQSRQRVEVAQSYNGIIPQGIHLTVGTGNLRSVIDGMATIELIGPTITLIVANEPLPVHTVIMPGMQSACGLVLLGAMPIKLVQAHALVTDIACKCGPVLAKQGCTRAVARLLDPLPENLVGTAGAMVADARALDIAGLVLATFQQDNLTVQNRGPSLRAVRAAKQAWSSIHETPGESHTLSNLACACGVSASSLSAGFRATYAISIGEHLAASRLDLARALLESGHSLTCAAFACGYSRSRFHEAFTSRFGSTPGQVARDA